MSVLRFAPVSPYECRERDNGVKEYRRAYLATLSDGKNPLSQLKRHRPDLQRWQPHEDDPSCYVRLFDAVPRKHSLIYDITVDWSNELDLPDDPLDRPAEIETTNSEIVVPVMTTYDGQPLLNTAGQFLEGTEDPFPLLTFSITKNISPSFPSWLADEYDQAVNIDTVNIDGIICPPRTLKIGRLRIGARQTENDSTFRQLQLELIRNKKTWDRFFLNRGTEEIVLRKWTNPKTKAEQIIRVREPIKNDLGEYITEPMFLDEDGRRPRVDENGKPVSLAAELKAMKNNKSLTVRVKEPLDTDDIIILRKQTRKPLPFSLLPLS